MTRVVRVRSKHQRFGTILHHVPINPLRLPPLTPRIARSQTHTRACTCTHTHMHIWMVNTHILVPPSPLGPTANPRPDKVLDARLIYASEHCLSLDAHSLLVGPHLTQSPCLLTLRDAARHLILFPFPSRSGIYMTETNAYPPPPSLPSKLQRKPCTSALPWNLF